MLDVSRLWVVLLVLHLVLCSDATFSIKHHTAGAASALVDAQNKFAMATAVHAHHVPAKIHPRLLFLLLLLLPLATEEAE